MISEYPIYCPVCGDEGDNSSASLELGSRKHIFQCFLKLFSVKWRGKVFTFCEECRSQLTLISELQRELQELKQRLAEREKELESKLVCSETTFERRNLYSRDRRYFKLRKEILGDEIAQPKPQPADYLNGRKIPAQLEQPLLLEDNKVEMNEPQEETEFYPNPNLNHEDDDHEQIEESDQVTEHYPHPNLSYDDDYHEQMEESDQPQLNEDSSEYIITTESHEQPQRRSKRRRKRKIVTDSPSEAEDEDTQDQQTPPSSSSSRPRTPINLLLVRKRQTVADSEPEQEAESDEDGSNEEFIPVQENKSEKWRTSAQTPKRRTKVEKDAKGKTITRHNIQLIRISGEDLYKCSECDVILPNKEHIIRIHVVKEHTTLYECSTCFKRFGQSSHLSRHIEISHRKTKSPQFLCPICARPFFRAEAVKGHEWTHFSQQDKAEALARGEKLPEWFTKKKFPCNKCYRSFATSGALEKHSSEKHEDTIKGEKELCNLCGAWVKNVKRHMRFKHVAEEDKKFECAICRKRFVLNCRLIKHRKLAHSNERPFKCDVCRKEFKLEANLKEHQLTHSNEKRFQCGICGMGFTRGFVLKRHVDTVHEGRIRSDNKKKEQLLIVSMEESV